VCAPVGGCHAGDGEGVGEGGGGGGEGGAACAFTACPPASRDAGSSRQGGTRMTHAAHPTRARRW